MNTRLQAAGETDVAKLNQARVYFEGIYPSKEDAQSKKSESDEALSVYNRFFPQSTPGIFDADQTRKRPEGTPSIEEWIRSSEDYIINGLPQMGWQKFRAQFDRGSGVVDQQAAPPVVLDIGDNMRKNFKKYVHEDGRQPQVVYNVILGVLQRQLEANAIDEAKFNELKAQLDEQLANIGQ
jgi:hypothetical protein